MGRRSGDALAAQGLAAALMVAATVAFLMWSGSLPEIERMLPAGWHFVAAGAAVALFVPGLLRMLRIRLPFPSPSETRSSDWDAAAQDVPRMVQDFLDQAARANASDIHIDPREEHVAVRFRVDGNLSDVLTLPVQFREAIANRIKVLSELSTFGRPQAQEGRFRFETADRTLDVRAQFLSTLLGERIVLHLLDGSAPVAGLSRVGLSTAQLATLDRLLQRPHGVVLFAGPPASGRTTTAYAAIRSLLRGRPRSISSLEDPIEYALPGVNQTQRQGVNTFAQGLTALLRLDSDIVLVGRIADGETGVVALEAGRARRLILATMEATSAARAIGRLVEMGVSRSLVAASVTVVVGQRLVRTLCPRCRRPAPPAAVAGLSLDTPTHGVGPHLPSGCGRCQQTGYSGTAGLFEVLEVDNDLADLIARGAEAAELEAAAMSRGMVPVDRVAVERVLAGDLSSDDVAQFRR